MAPVQSVMTPWLPIGEVLGDQMERPQKVYAWYFSSFQKVTTRAH